MDLKTVELEILKINEDFITYLDKINQEADEKAESLLRELELKVEDKSTFIKTLESKIVSSDEEFKSKISEYASKLDSIVKYEKQLKYDIEEAKLELEKQKAEELKPFLLQQKKKKTELTHKITAQKKELSFLHKDNNSKLIEEEKNFKSREVELTRRMGIDLDRVNEANVKQYSDIEKSILDMEDERLIRDAQKKINSIRLVGIKEMLAIKNKYAELNQINSLDFKKFQEKIVLENSILTEEFKQRVKALEYEKELLEIEEESKLVIIDFNNELKLREFEKENELDQCEFEKQRANEKYKINIDIINTRKNDNKIKVESINNIYNEIYKFDKVQVTEFIIGDSFLISAEKKAVESLIMSLKNYIISFKNIFIISVEDYSNKRKDIINNLIYLLSSSKFDQIYGSNTSYSDFVKNLTPLINDYVKANNNSFNKFNSIIKAMVKGLEDQFNLAFMSIKEFWKENENLTNSFYSSVSKMVENENKNSSFNLINYYGSHDNKINNIAGKEKNDYEKIIQDLKEKTKKIISDYNIRKKDILDKIDNYKKELKLKEDKDKKELNKFIKQSKLKISNHKKIYNENLANHEKIEHNLYKEAIKQNKIEYKNRLESIN